MATWQQIEAAERRRQREAQRRLRELERRAKEQARQSAEEQARLEVETYENRLEVLLSVHKEQAELWDWASVAASLPPPSPENRSDHEQRAYIEALVAFSPLAEVSDLGSSINFTVHTANLIEAALKVNGTQAIPTEVKTLTATGKVSVRCSAGRGERESQGR